MYIAIDNQYHMLIVLVKVSYIYNNICKPGENIDTTCKCSKKSSRKQKILMQYVKKCFQDVYLSIFIPLVWLKI